MMARIFTSLALLLFSWFLMVLVDDSPGRLSWPEALVFLVLVYAAWQAVRELLEWYRKEG